MNKKKIVIIGGGLSSFTSAFYLTQVPNWQEKYEISIYQLGWRCGGKGASGVNKNIGYRIEEHGLHLWMGFYENAFRMMQNIYTQLNRNPNLPLSSFEKAFKGQPFMIFAENVKSQWRDWQINFPILPGKPGQSDLPNFEGIFDIWFDFIIDQIKNIVWNNDEEKPKEEAPHGFFGEVSEWFHEKATAFDDWLDHAFFVVFEKMLRLARFLVLSIDDSRSKIVQALNAIRKWFWDKIGHLVEGNDTVRRAWIILDFFTAVFTGLCEDNALTVQDGKFSLDFDILNTYDYIEWLEKNGADKDLTIPSPLVKSMYDGPFAFLKGDVNQPNIEAGTILRIFFRLAFTCKENVVWRMQAGMGDTIFAPAYQLLKNAGVNFHFFQPARKIHLNEQKDEIESIEIGVQARTNGEYNPLFNVNDLDCWPSEPLIDQIIPEDQEIVKTHDLESYWNNLPDRDTKTLMKGVDFDEVILGCSIESLKGLADEIIDSNENWQYMMKEIKTVSTQAFQLWLNQSAEELGIDDQKLLSSYTEPVDTFSAMNQLLEREKWTLKNNPKYIAYLCGAMPVDYYPPATDKDFDQKIKQQAKDYFIFYINNHLKHLIPNAFDENGEFKWEYLANEDDLKGMERLSTQYWRGNVSPSELYVLSVKNSSRFRIKTNQTGINNLKITGDWIQNGMNAGFVEGGVTSGMLTAEAVSGCDFDIIGLDWCK